MSKTLEKKEQDLYIEKEDAFKDRLDWICKEMSDTLTKRVYSHRCYGTHSENPEFNEKEKLDFFIEYMWIFRWFIDGQSDTFHYIFVQQIKESFYTFYSDIKYATWRPSPNRYSNPDIDLPQKPINFDDFKEVIDRLFSDWKKKLSVIRKKTHQKYKKLSKSVVCLETIKKKNTEQLDKIQNNTNFKVVVLWYEYVRKQDKYSSKFDVDNYKSHFEFSCAKMATDSIDIRYSVMHFKKLIEIFVSFFPDYKELIFLSISTSDQDQKNTKEHKIKPIEERMYKSFLILGFYWRDYMDFYLDPEYDKETYDKKVKSLTKSGNISECEVDYFLHPISIEFLSQRQDEGIRLSIFDLIKSWDEKFKKIVPGITKLQALFRGFRVRMSMGPQPFPPNVWINILEFFLDYDVIKTKILNRFYMAHIHLDICKCRRTYFLPLETPKRLLRNHYKRRNSDFLTRFQEQRRNSNFLTRFPEPWIDKYYWREEYRKNIYVEIIPGHNYKFITKVTKATYGQSEGIFEVWSTLL